MQYCHATAQTDVERAKEAVHDAAVEELADYMQVWAFNLTVSIQERCGQNALVRMSMRLAPTIDAAYIFTASYIDELKTEFLSIRDRLVTKKLDEWEMESDE